MNTDRIKEIQQETAYPESVSVQQALLKVWNETEQEQLRIHDVSQRSELLKAFYAYVDDKWALGMLTDKVDEVIEGFEKSL